MDGLEHKEVIYSYYKPLESDGRSLPHYLAHYYYYYYYYYYTYNFQACETTVISSYVNNTVKSP
jgi:hypothetical protein